MRYPLTPHPRPPPPASPPRGAGRSRDAASPRQANEESDLVVRRTSFRWDARWCIHTCGNDSEGVVLTDGHNARGKVNGVSGLTFPLPNVLGLPDLTDSRNLCAGSSLRTASTRGTRDGCGDSPSFSTSRTRSSNTFFVNPASREAQHR